MPGDIEKADSQTPGRTSGMRISGILHFEHVPLGISADSKLWSLHSENHCGAWNFKQFNSHGTADQQISLTALPQLSSVWEVGVGVVGGQKTGDQGRHLTTMNKAQLFSFCSLLISSPGHFLPPHTHPKGHSDLSWYRLATKFPSSKLNRWRGFSHQMWAWLGAGRKERLSSEEPRKTHTAQGHCHQIAMESRCGPFQPNPAELSATCPDNCRQNSLQWWSNAARGPGSWWPTGNALYQPFLTLQPTPPHTNHYSA